MELKVTYCLLCIGSPVKHFTHPINSGVIPSLKLGGKLVMSQTSGQQSIGCRCLYNRTISIEYTTLNSHSNGFVVILYLSSYRLPVVNNGACASNNRKLSKNCFISQYNFACYCTLYIYIPTCYVSRQVLSHTYL